MRISRLIVIAITVFALMGIYYGVGYLRATAAAKTTEARMQQWSVFLGNERPKVINHEVLLRILEKYNRMDYMTDAWETTFEIQISQDDIEPTYTIRSFGRDRTRGDCCRGHVENRWNEDAVLEGDVWLQYW